MAGLYNKELVKIFATDIKDQIGIDNLYTPTNLKYSDAPKNVLVADKRVIVPRFKALLEKSSNLKTLYIIPDPNAGDNIYGMYHRSNDIVHIVISEKPSFCWQRFALLKELCSLYIDHYEEIDSSTQRYTNYLDSVKNAFDQKGNYVQKDGIDEGDIDSENFSILVATELMIPSEYRSTTEGLLDLVARGSLTLNDVSKSLLIPEFILKHYIDNFLKKD